MTTGPAESIKKAMADYSLVPQLTAAEAFWYYTGCVFFGAAYFAKLPAARGPRYRRAT